MKSITGKTRITGLFGYPVEHSLSPPMHNAAFESIGLDYCYLPFLVKPDYLGDAVNAIRALDMIGVNVTIPHKESVIPLLTNVDEEASFIGAVNTIVNSGGRLTGYNTDGRGFIRSLAENNIDIAGKKILIAGAGGASKAISYYISEKAEILYIFDIVASKSQKIVSDLSGIRSNVSCLEKIGSLADFDIVINATPLGLGIQDPLPFDLSTLTSDHIVCDLIYKKTTLLEYASKTGCRSMDGSGMLLWQGALAFQLWTGILPPVDIMRKVLMERIHQP